MSEPTLSVDEFVEYCQLQARLLAGTVETMTEEASEMLDAIDDGVAAIETSLDETSETTPRPTTPETSTGCSDDDVDLDSLRQDGASLEEQQSRLKAKQARIELYQELANGYASLAETLQNEEPSPEDAFEQVVTFEAETDAPAYFDERETLYETVVSDSGADMQP